MRTAQDPLGGREPASVTVGRETVPQDFGTHGNGLRKARRSRRERDTTDVIRTETDRRRKRIHAAAGRKPVGADRDRLSGMRCGAVGVIQDRGHADIERGFICANGDADDAQPIERANQADVPDGIADEQADE